MNMKVLSLHRLETFIATKHWFIEFNRGRISFVDEYRESRPKSVLKPENVDAVRQMIENHRHVTYR